MSKNKESYDEIVYDTLPHQQGNLRQLETVADLFQVEPIDIRNCRVLELGTATGKTIIPQAECFPESSFIGIDLSDIQVAEGNKMIGQLGLKNIELRPTNIMDVDDSWGKFDYIIVHGIYSWVPPFVREKILDICNDNLSPRGIAMVSYNTYPGWYFKNYTRNLMLFHSKIANQFGGPEIEVQQSRAIVNFVADKTKSQKDYFGMYQQHICEHLKQQEDYYLFHEYLEEENNPFLFSEFCTDLKKRDLEYVSDFFWADFNLWLESYLLKDLVARIDQQEVLEQYVDYLMNRAFRSSVFCHRETAKNRSLRTDFANRYSFYLPINHSMREKDGCWGCFRKETFSSLKLPKNQLHDALVQVMTARQQGCYTLKELWKEVDDCAAALPPDGTLKYEAFVTTINILIKYGHLKPLLHSPESVPTGSERPKANAFVRHLAKNKKMVFPNPHFESTKLDAVSSFVLERLDGEHSILEVTRDVQSEVKAGRIQIMDQERRIAHDDRKAMIEIVENSVKQLQQTMIL